MRPPSPIRFSCQSCGRALEASGAEVFLTCPGCGSPVLVPSEPTESGNGRQARLANALTVLGFLVIITGTSDAISEAQEREKKRKAEREEELQTRNQPTGEEAERRPAERQ